MFADRDALAPSAAHELALDCLAAGIEAGSPERAVERHCELDGDVLRVRDAAYDLSGFDDVVVLGGGKGADGLAAALEALLGDRVSGGVVVTHERTAAPERVAVRVGEHPTPGEGSLAGASAVLERAATADERTLVLAAVTGGGSALLCAPAEGLSVEDVVAVTAGLLEAGAPVDEVNAVRRACSRVKGGGLAATAAPATVVGLLVSDVGGDDPAVVASGPTVPVESDPAEALAVLDRYDVAVPHVREWLRDLRAGERPVPTSEVGVDNHVLVSGRDAVAAASEVAAERGYEPCVLSTRFEGDAAEAGRFHASVAAEVASSGEPVEPPAVLLSGGETTVDVTGDGVGGPNLEFTLASALELPDGVALGAVDTDGSDGSTDVAGALVDAGTVDDAAAAQAALAENGSYAFLDACGALLRTGATGTNVDDLRVVVVERPARS